MKGGIIALVVLFLVGCGSLEKFDIPNWKTPNRYSLEEMGESILNDDKISGSFVDFPLNEIWRLIPVHISYAFSEELKDKTITMEVNEITVSQFFSLVSNQLGVDYTQDDNIYYIGKLDYRQFSVFVSRLDGFTDDEIKRIIDGIKSNDGKATMLKGGVFLLSDRWASIQRINSVIRQIKNLRLKNYDLNIWLVSENCVKSFYAKHNLSGRYSMEWMAGHMISVSNWNMIANALVDWSVNMGESLGVRQFSAVLKDGKEFKFTSGEKVPVLKKTITDNGTVSTTGVEYIDVGTVINSKLSRVDDFTALVDFSCEISTSERQIEEYPVKISNKYETSVTMKHGEVVVIGRYDYKIKKKYILGLENEKSAFYVVCSLNVR